MTETELIAGASKGKEAALQEWVATTRPSVEEVCALFLDGEDGFPSAVVGAYSRAFQSLAQGQVPDRPVDDWMRAQAARECFVALERMIRDFGQQTSMLESLAGSIPTLVEISSDPQERVNFMVRGDIDDIAEQPRQTLAMHELEGLRLPAMAQRMGCSWAAAMRRLMEARQSLAKRVKENFGL